MLLWLSQMLLLLSQMLLLFSQMLLLLSQMCSIAAAKLHTLLQTRPVDKMNESCYVMAVIDEILRDSLTGALSTLPTSCEM